MVVVILSEINYLIETKKTRQFWLVLKLRIRRAVFDECSNCFRGKSWNPKAKKVDKNIVFQKKLKNMILSAIY